MTRKVTIINSKTQSQNVIQSEATTLGELKTEMSNAGIDYSGMAFYEGHMRAELKDDNSPLPTNIPYKGRTVNDLVFMLTLPDKKVASGANTRTGLYAKIKEYGLQGDCVKLFGKNFTQCTTAQLERLVEDYDTPHCEVIPAGEGKAGKNPLVDTIYLLVDILYNNRFLSDENLNSIKNTLESTPAETKMSQEEIDEMFDFI